MPRTGPDAERGARPAHRTGPRGRERAAELQEETTLNSHAPLTGSDVVQSVTAPPVADPPGSGRPLTRRSAGLIMLGTVPTVAAVLAIPPHAGRPEPTSEPPTGLDSFEETYRGRHISGRELPGGAAGEPAAWQVTVDGRPLHLMRRADGSYLTMVDHYTCHATPLAAARSAVRELGDQALRADDARPAAARERGA